MRVVLLMVWGLVLLVFTCAADSNFWSSGTMPYFRLVPSPDFRDLFEMDIRLNSNYMIRKMGHAAGFLLWGVLLFQINKSYYKSICYGTLYAMLTEIFQLYFGRDGRLYDMAIGMSGVLLAMIMIQAAQRLNLPSHDQA